MIVIFIDKNTDFKLIHAVFIYIFGFILSMVIFFMPANLGISETSYTLALKMLNYDPALGVTMGLVKRLVSFIRAGIGILLLLHAGFFKRNKG